ncbi:MAG TPA: dihydrodipicolinate synthase family protein [Xanthobacteraceae bacterium]|jgi:4-hydroxy-tetrahydrodipicolinate synthase|nr:dihydrodipicolinate synthase family protein [Xanthobacteraceae bacterium]
MPAFQPGLVHLPVTPFTPDRSIDYDRLRKLIDFHIRNGADALALPTHVGESVSLTDSEKRALIEFAVKHIAGRKPLIAHVSEAGTAVAAALARHAQDAGAAAILATTPYYWTPPPEMILEHFAQIGAAVRLPFLVHNAPEDMSGIRVSAELMLKLIGRLENFAGLVDASLDWQFMIDLIMEARHARPGFLLISGTELMVSSAAIGATALFAPLAGIAPRLLRTLFELCRDDKLFEARAAQEDVAALRALLKAGGVASLKAALAARGRDCGAPRPPLQALDARAADALKCDLDSIAALRDEPRGW